MAKQPAKYDPGLAGMGKVDEMPALERWLWMLDRQQTTTVRGKTRKLIERRAKERDKK